MSAEQNKAIVRRIFEDVINTGNLGAVEAVVAPTYVYRTPGMPDVHGPGGFKELVSTYRSAFPDLTLTILDQIAEGDRVVTSWRGTGTHRGDMMGIAPTGKTIDVIGIIITRLEGGKAVDDLEVLDQLGMLQQLGVVPTPG